MAPILAPHIGRIITGQPTARDWETVAEALSHNSDGFVALTAYLMVACFRDQWDITPPATLTQIRLGCEECIIRAGIPIGRFFAKGNNKERRQLLTELAKEYIRGESKNKRITQ